MFIGGLPADAEDRAIMQAQRLGPPLGSDIEADPLRERQLAT